MTARWPGRKRSRPNRSRSVHSRSIARPATFMATLPPAPPAACAESVIIGPAVRPREEPLPRGTQIATCRQVLDTPPKELLDEGLLLRITDCRNVRTGGAGPVAGSRARRGGAVPPQDGR